MLRNMTSDKTCIFQSSERLEELFYLSGKTITDVILTQPFYVCQGTEIWKI